MKRTKRMKSNNSLPPFGRTIIEVAAGTEIRCRRGGTMVVQPGSVVTERANMWMVPEDAQRLRAHCPPEARTIH